MPWRIRTSSMRCLIGRRVRRGEIWTVAGAKDYAGKPRPAVILQDESL